MPYELFYWGVGMVFNMLKVFSESIASAAEVWICDDT